MAVINEPRPALQSLLEIFEVLVKDLRGLVLLPGLVGRRPQPPPDQVP